MEKMSFRQALLESLQEDTKRFQKKVRKNPPPKAITVNDIDEYKFYQELGSIDGHTEECLYNELAELENLNYKIWVFRNNKEREYLDITIDGLKCRFDSDDAEANLITYIEYNNGKISIYTDTPSLVMEYPESFVKLYVKYPHIFEKYGFDREKFLK